MTCGWVAMRRALPLLILAGLLLAAQHAALTHATWHAYRGSSSAQRVPGAGNGAAKDTAPESSLCRFDVAFGQVLGGAHGSGCDICAPELATERTVPSPRPYAAAIALSFHSRAPPVLL